MPKQPDPPTAFWQRAREIEERLPDAEAFLVVSKAEWRSGTCEGQFSEVTRFRAAQLLAKETHRLAAPDECEEYYAAIRKRREDRALAEAKKEKPFVMYVQPGQVPVGAMPVDVQPPAPPEKPATRSK